MKSFIVFLLILAFLYYYATNLRVFGDEESFCPAGSYEIGKENDKPLCKQQPTGCPYGDSIPLDSPKCAPPDNQASIAASTESHNVETVYFEGK